MAKAHPLNEIPVKNKLKERLPATRFSLENFWRNLGFRCRNTLVFKLLDFQLGSAKGLAEPPLGGTALWAFPFKSASLVRNVDGLAEDRRCLPEILERVI